jgi:hypothetical protein
MEEGEPLAGLPMPELLTPLPPTPPENEDEDEDEDEDDAVEFAIIKYIEQKRERRQRKRKMFQMVQDLLISKVESLLCHESSPVSADA